MLVIYFSYRFTIYEHKRSLKVIAICPNCDQAGTIQLEEQVMDVQEALFVFGYTGICPHCHSQVQFKELP